MSGKIFWSEKYVFFGTGNDFWSETKLFWIWKKDKTNEISLLMWTYSTLICGCNFTIFLGRKQLFPDLELLFKCDSPLEK